MMASFLQKEKTWKSFEKEISHLNEHTQDHRRSAVRIFEDFTKKHYKRNAEQVIDELLKMKAESTQEEYEDSLYGMLQDWITYCQKREYAPTTIRVAFTNLRIYLYFMGIKTDDQDVKHRITLPKKIKEERHPLSKYEYRLIVETMHDFPLRQAMLLVLGSSGLRFGEAMKLRKKDLDTSGKRVRIHVRFNTKTRAGRTTFMSNEAYERLKSHLEKIGPDDYVFDDKKINYKNFQNIMIHALHRSCKRLGLDQKYESNNIGIITSHSFRAYFFTKAARKHGENYAHKLVGHGGYLMQYDRMTEDEKLEMYMDLEPDLVIYDQSKNEVELERLREENQDLKEMKKEIQSLKDEIARKNQILDVNY